MTTATTNTVTIETSVLEAMNKRMEELEAKLKAKPAKVPASKNSMMKLCDTKTGKKMLYFTTPSMIAHSETKGKDYQASILLQAHQIEPFLSAMKDGSLQKLAKTFMENEWADTKITH